MDAVEQQDYDFPDIEYQSIQRCTDTHTLFRIEGRTCWIKCSQVADLDEDTKTFNIPRQLAIDLEIFED